MVPRDAILVVFGRLKGDGEVRCQRLKEGCEGLLRNTGRFKTPQQPLGDSEGEQQVPRVALLFNRGADTRTQLGPERGNFLVPRLQQQLHHVQRCLPDLLRVRGRVHLSEELPRELRHERLPAASALIVTVQAAQQRCVAAEQREEAAERPLHTLPVAELRGEETGQRLGVLEVQPRLCGVPEALRQQLDRLAPALRVVGVGEGLLQVNDNVQELQSLSVQRPHDDGEGCLSGTLAVEDVGVHIIIYGLSEFYAECGRSHPCGAAWTS
mmetsp:Transcript_107742/g.300270  ORF Transcript_107742/g.300270 Transcript_107742/m.300270 type:complete len:268 (-) Transcript_107742:1-804(-)